MTLELFEQFIAFEFEGYNGEILVDFWD